MSLGQGRHDQQLLRSLVSWWVRGVRSQKRLRIVIITASSWLQGHCCYYCITSHCSTLWPCHSLTACFSLCFFFLSCSSAAAAAAKSLQSCLTLCDPIDNSPPGSPVPGILQARTLEWVAISFSNAWKWKVKVKLLSRVQLFATPWTAAPSMGFSRQEYWSGVPLPSLLDPSTSWLISLAFFN